MDRVEQVARNNKGNTRACECGKRWGEGKIRNHLVSGADSVVGFSRTREGAREMVGGQERLRSRTHSHTRANTDDHSRHWPTLRGALSPPTWVGRKGWPWEEDSREMTRGWNEGAEDEGRWKRRGRSYDYEFRLKTSLKNREGKKEKRERGIMEVKK